MRQLQFLFVFSLTISFFFLSGVAESALVAPFNRAIAMEEYLADHELDPIEGIWSWRESYYGGQMFEVAIIPNMFDYEKYKEFEYVGISSDSTGYIKEGQTKILLKKTGDRSYEGQFIFVVKDALSKAVRTFDVAVHVDKEGDTLSFNVPPVEIFGSNWVVNGEKLWPEKATGPGADQPGTGTGFFISRDIIVTNAHVVKGFQNAGVCFMNKKYDANIIARDEVNDLALLKVNFNDFKAYQAVKPLLFGDVHGVVDGEEVYSIGYPMVQDLGINPKINLGIINSTSGYGGDPRMFQISIPLQPGNSGGPLFNEWGNVIGITSSGLNVAYYMQVQGFSPQNVNFAIKADYLNNLLISSPGCPELKKGSKNNLFKAKEIMANWRDSVVLVICE